MRMKEVCTRTRLTERAVRLYISKGLCEPGQRNGILDFTAQDARRLADIACLRQLDFSIEQIRRMIEEPGCVRSVIGERIDEVQAQMAHGQDILDALQIGEAEDMRALVRQIEKNELEPIEPDFSGFDDYSPEEKALMRAEGARDLKKQKRRASAQLIGLIAAVGVIALVWGYGMFLGAQRLDIRYALPQVCIEEYDVSRAAVTAKISGYTWEPVEKIGLERVTAQLDLETQMGIEERRISMGEFLPGTVFGGSGDECALRLQLSNGALMKMGKNPLKAYDGISMEEKLELLERVLAMPEEERWDELRLELF